MDLADSIQANDDTGIHATREHHSLLASRRSQTLAVPITYDGQISSSRGSQQSKDSTHSSPVGRTSPEDKQEVTTIGWLKAWWTDLASVFVSVGLLIAVFAVLLSVDDTPLADWSMPFGIQPTALVAILITLCKLFLLDVVAEGISQLKWVYFEQRSHKLEDLERFDNASRGVWGSMKFLYFIHWQAIFGFVGALITILAVAMAPFAQQSLSFYTKAVADPESPPSVYRSNSYDTNIGMPLFSTYVYHSRDDFLSSVDTQPISNYASMMSAVLRGLYNPESNAEFDCKTSSCIWPSYETLGICSTCEDVTASLTTRCYPASNTSYMVGSNYFNEGGHCKYTTPSGLELVGRCDEPEVTLWTSTTSYASTRKLARLPIITAVAALLFPEQGECHATAANFSMRAPQATECKLSWCSKTFESKAVNGTISETVVQTNDLVFPPGPCNGTSNWPPLFQEDSHIPAWTVREDVGADDLFRFAAFKKHEVLENLCDDWQHHDNPAFWINAQDNLNVRHILDTVFTGRVSNAAGTNVGNMLYTVNNGNITANVMGVAESMTNEIRSGPNSTAHLGTAHINETYIRVNWVWLTYPAVLVALSILFLFGTVIFSAEKSQVVWKSSSLALLFHGLKESDRETSVRKQSDMEEVAKQIWVRLKEDDNGNLNLVRGQHQSTG
ncbi:hypothetical protein LTR37_020196 [Vermiconidia calcicola]|uniref:Uncharacterized protein n=1 Tax=Vermiconidia calcicola TaxID=1690605 RepID=A0ACC3MDZ3_9PEZI|nr:hypothetical protein LTR37_020196 [Vermiconidia calcicola]